MLKLVSLLKSVVKLVDSSFVFLILRTLASIKITAEFGLLVVFSFADFELNA